MVFLHSPRSGGLHKDLPPSNMPCCTPTTAARADRYSSHQCVCTHKYNLAHLGPQLDPCHVCYPSDSGVTRPGSKRFGWIRVSQSGASDGSEMRCLLVNTFALYIGRRRIWIEWAPGKRIPAEEIPVPFYVKRILKSLFKCCKRQAIALGSTKAATLFRSLTFKPSCRQ
jgi:hypothetical protein